MAITINGTANTVAGLAVGGLPDGTVDADTLASGAGGAALTGSTNNTVCTVTGSGAFQGEANLTFDGSMLQVTGDQQWSADGAGANELKWDAGDAKLYFRDNIKAAFGTGGDLEIYHDGTVNHVRTQNGNLVLGTQNNHMVILGAYYGAGGGGDTVEVWGGANMLPASNDAIDLGETNHKWDDIYATNSSIQTSDQNTKDNITASDLGLSFINKLSPKSYKFKGKTRTHYGLIAQDIETVLGDISKPTADFAGFIKTPAPEQLYTERDEAHNRIPSGKAIGDVKLAAHTDYGLRYTEFIGPLVKAVQELSAEVETLKTKVAALEAG